MKLKIKAEWMLPHVVKIRKPVEIYTFDEAREYEFDEDTGKEILKLNSHALYQVIEPKKIVSKDKVEKKKEEEIIT